MRYRPSIEEALADAAVPAGPRHAEQAAVAASRRRIETDLAETVWQEALHRDAYAQRVLDVTRGVPSMASAGLHPRPPVALREQAAYDLAELSRLAITTSSAAADIAGLVNSRRIEPDGALIFACLLHLADRQNGAQFWWQFSAGAGRSTAALCLYLLHLQRGEMRDADHWAQQATVLELLDSTPAPSVEQPMHAFYAWGECRPLYEQGYSTVESMLLRIKSSLWEEDSGGDPGPPCRGLTTAVARLAVGHDPDFGAVPRPDPGLAKQLECIA